MFESGAYNLKKFRKMHKHCPNCGVRFEKEPSFFDGAMYVSYAFQVAIIVAVIVATYLLEIDGSIGWYIGWIGGLIVALLPVIYRLSRSIWAHVLIPFRGNTLIKAEE